MQENFFSNFCFKPFSCIARCHPRNSSFLFGTLPSASFWKSFSHSKSLFINHLPIQQNCMMSFPQLLHWWIYSPPEVLQLQASAPPDDSLPSQEVVQNLSKNQVTVTARLLSPSRVTLVLYQSTIKLCNEECRALVPLALMTGARALFSLQMETAISGFWTPLNQWSSLQRSLCHGNQSRELISSPLSRHPPWVSSYRGLKIHACVNSSDWNRSFHLPKSPPSAFLIC